MERRKFIKAGVIGAAAVPLATPAIAQGVMQWKMVTAWPKNLPGPGVAAQMLADRLTTLSGGRIEVKLFAAGELVPGRGVFDAVSEGTAELYHAVPAYWGSKSKGILLFGSQPFGLRADEQVGWLYHGGGQVLYDEMYGRFGIKPFLCGNSGPQWGGWFRNEIKSVEDLKGLKFRTTGLASEALDAGEFIGPWTDSALGYQQIAKNYYWPGVGEPSSAEECGVNAAVYDALDDDLKQAVALACESLYNPVWSEYTTKHAISLQKLVKEDGVQVRMFPQEVIDAMGVAAAEVIEELRNDDDELVRRITESFVAHRDSIGAYMTYADNGQMNARAQVMGY